MKSKTNVEIIEWIGSELEIAYKSRDAHEEKLSKIHPQYDCADYGREAERLVAVESRITTLKDMLLFLSE